MSGGALRSYHIFLGIYKAVCTSGLCACSGRAEKAGALADMGGSAQAGAEGRARAVNCLPGRGQKAPHTPKALSKDQRAAVSRRVKRVLSQLLTSQGHFGGHA